MATIQDLYYVAPSQPKKLPLKSDRKQRMSTKRIIGDLKKIYEKAVDAQTIDC